MSKEHSQSNTRLTPNKAPSKNLTLHQQTMKAFKYYSHIRKDYLQNIKKSYLARMEDEKYLELQRRDPSEEQRLRKKKKKKKKEIQKRKVINEGEKKKHSRKINYQQVPSSPQEVEQKPMKEQKEKPNMSSVMEKEAIQENLYPEGTFQLKPIHQYLLNLQRTIDSYLSYQFQNRRKRSLPLQEMFTFLKTTSFGLNCRKNFRYLNIYNCHLYNQSGENIFCLGCSSKLQERVLETRKRMSQKQIEQLLI